MKINWGTGIAIFYSIFVFSLVFQVFKSRQYDNSLVVDNYYEEDLNYQKRYEELQQAQLLEDGIDVVHDKASNMVEIQFPKGVISGEILFFRPMTNREDELLSIELNHENSQIIPVDHLSKGLWRLKMHGTLNGKAFYQEEVVIL